jgi:cytochrome d ubiquinol oxidase subunit I
VGRQPWIVFRIQRTAAAVNPAPGLVYGFLAVLAVYAVLTVATVYVLRRLAGRGADEPESGIPAPPQEDAPLRTDA